MIKAIIFLACFLAYSSSEAIDSCFVGDRICINSTSYEVCDLISGSVPSFNPSPLTCQAGFLCQQFGTDIFCVASTTGSANPPPPASTTGSSAGSCTVGDRKCINSTSYEVCDSSSGSPAFNPSAQSCRPGLMCQQTSATRVDCVSSTGSSGASTTGSATPSTTGSSTPSTTGSSGSCTVGDRHCINSTSYQICDSSSGSPAFNPASQTCQPGLMCQQTTATRVDCVSSTGSSSGSSSGSTTGSSVGSCTIGARKCINSTSYEVCDSSSGSPAFNPSSQSCQAGLMCQQTSATRVDCVRPPVSSTTGSSSGSSSGSTTGSSVGTCAVGDRRCISSTMFQVCDLISGPTPSFNPSSLTCATGTMCHQTGNIVYCS